MVASQDAKVTRIKGTFAKKNPEMDDLAGIARQSVTLMREKSTRLENEEFLIKHETVKQIWTPDQAGRETGAKLRDHVIQKIGSICSCRIDWTNEVAQDMEVKGDNEEDVGRAISKLNLMEKAIVRLQTSFRSRRSSA